MLFICLILQVYSVRHVSQITSQIQNDHTQLSKGILQALQIRGYKNLPYLWYVHISPNSVCQLDNTHIHNTMHDPKPMVYSTELPLIVMLYVCHIITSCRLSQPKIKTIFNDLFCCLATQKFEYHSTSLKVHNYLTLFKIHISHKWANTGCPNKMLTPFESKFL